MFLQDQCDGSTQTSHETLGLPNPRRLSYQNTGRDFRFDHWTEAMPLSRNITYDDDLFRRKTSDDHAHAAADRTRHSFKSTDGQRIADLGQREQVLESRPIGRRTRLLVVAKSGAVRGVHFPAAASTTRTLRTLWIEGNVAEFTGHAVEPTRQ